jgi:hypothetical protein
LNYKIITIIVLTVIIGFLFVLIDVFRVLSLKEGGQELYYSNYIKFKIAIDAYIKRFLILFLFLFLVVYKLILEYMFSIVIDNQLYNSLLVTAIIMLGIYSYMVIFNVEY